MSAFTRGGVALTALAVVVGVAGCSGDDGKKDTGAAKPAATKKAEAKTAVPGAVIAAAYKKTSGAKSAKIKMTMKTPTATGTSETVNMSGVMGWDPSVMDLTVDASAMGAAAEPGMPEKIRTVMIKNVMYMDMGTASAKEMDGKRWLKIDIAAAAKQSGDKAATDALTGGLQDANQDPARQLAMLVDSPSIKHLGGEKVDGVQAEHYKGSLTFQEMLDANSAYDTLPAKERKDLIAAMKTEGMKKYDTDVWVNSEGYPVRMDVKMSMAAGTTEVSEHFSDYGTKVTAEVPPADQTVDLFAMLGELGADGAGATS